LTSQTPQKVRGLSRDTPPAPPGAATKQISSEGSATSVAQREAPRTSAPNRLGSKPVILRHRSHGEVNVRFKPPRDSDRSEHHPRARASSRRERSLRGAASTAIPQGTVRDHALLRPPRRTRSIARLGGAMNQRAGSTATGLGLVRIGRRVLLRNFGFSAPNRPCVDSQVRNGACDLSFKPRFERRASAENTATGKSAVFSKDLGGEQSPGRPEFFRAGNGAVKTTNPTREQRLEAVETARGQGSQ